MREKVFNDIKQQMLNYEKILSKNACKSVDAIREYKLNEDIRPSFARDTDRIIHTLAFTRYLDKTQVFSNENNDNISKRMTHVQFVSRASRTIARALGLNEDLCEAISLGHDIGHTPFGHTGEHILDKISKKYLGYYFAHNLNSVRQLTVIENGGKGCNLSLQVLDGIMCHNGEMVKSKYMPMEKDLNIFKKEYNDCMYDDSLIKNIRPMTLEGCVVRISDIIGYIGKDIEDAVRLGKFNVKDIPEDIKENLGVTNHDIMNSIILDIIEQSYNKPYIQMSDKMYELVVKLKKFNMENIYLKANDEERLDEYEEMFNKLFEVYLNALKNEDKQNDIYLLYLNNMNEEYLKEKKEQQVIDFIAGMTDNFMIREYNKYVKNVKE